VSLEAWYWCASIFGWALCTGVGIPPVPEEAGILYAAGVTALHPEVRWWAAWPAVSLGIIAADLTLYFAGWLFGERILDHRWMRLVLSPERRRRLEDRFHRHGMKFLLLARVLPPLRTGVFVMSGSIRYPLIRFLIADLSYAVVGVGLVFFGGAAAMSVVHGLGGWLMLAIAVAVGAYLLHRYYGQLRRLELKASVEVTEAVAPVVAPEEASGGKEGHAASQPAEASSP
jgi:membrane protein DedA with SNARE-associated domain